MAIASIILGGIAGMLSSLLGWLFVGLSLMSMIQVYLTVGFGLSLSLITLATLRHMLARSDLHRDARVA